jgi:hypothetical protein
VSVLVCLATLSACGSLEKKSALINPGDQKAQVLAVMGPPQDRQFRDKNEVWQYCVTGAGFGYHDYRMVWFYDGRVTGITSYKDSTPASSCQGHFKAVNWEEAPDKTIEIRNR